MRIAIIFQQILIRLNVFILSALMSFSCSRAEEPGKDEFQQKPGWELVWSDDFDYQDPDLNKYWIAQNSQSGHILCSRWRENAVVESGMNLANEFHTYALEWSKDSLIYSFDGKVMRRINNDICHSQAPVYLSEAIISWAGAVTDAIDGTSMVVDWVKEYQLK